MGRREGKFAQNTFILAIGTLFPKLASFITLPLLTAYLTKEEYGTYDLILTLVSLVLPIATLQIQTAAFRFLIDVRHDEEEKKSIITNIFIFIIPTSFIALAAMYWYLRNQELVIRVMICGYFLFDLLANANRQIVRGLSKNVYYTISASISAVGQVILLYALVMGLRRGLAGCTIALAISELVATIFLFLKGGIYKYIDIKTFSAKKTKQMLQYSWPMIPNSLSMWVMRVSDRLVIVAYMGVAANAVYGVANKIPSILNYVHTTFNMAWQESASMASKDNDAGKFYSSMFELLFNLVSGGMALLLGITPAIFAIFVRGDYTEAYNQIPVLYIAIFFCCLSSFWGGIYVAYRRTKSVGLTALAAAACNLIVDITTIKWLGLYAASGSTLVSYLALCIFRVVDTRKFVNLTYKWKHIGLIFAILLAQCIISFQRQTILDIINFVLGAAVCLALNRKLISVMLKKVYNKTLKLMK